MAAEAAPEKPKKKRRLIFAVVTAVVLMVAGVGLGLVWWLNRSTAAGNFLQTPRPLSVTQQLGEAKGSNVITAEGGQVDLATTDNGEVLLELGPQSVLESVRITLQETTGLSGLPAGMEFKAGVQAAPDGLSLGKSGWLYFDIPQNADAAGLAGYRYHGDGEEFHLYPLERHEDKLRMPVAGFSGFGIVYLAADFTDEPVPTAVEDQASAALGKIMWQKGTLNFDAGYAEKAAAVNTEGAAILRKWYTDSLKPHFEAAVKDDSIIDSTLSEYINWLTYAQLLDIEDQLADEIAAMKEFKVKVLQNGVEKSAERCREDKQPGEIAIMVRWLSYAQLLGVSDDDSGDFAGVFDKADACGKFKLNIISSFKDSQAYGNSVRGVGEGILAVDSRSLTIKGEGHVRELEPSVYGSPSCTSSGSGEMPFKIPEFRLGLGVADSKKSSVSMLVSFDEVGDYDYDCKLGDTGSGGLGIPETLWLYEFSGAHEDINVGLDSYALQDWEYVGTDSVYARKVFKGTKDGIIEDTVFELIHTPQ